uniref:Uncharacterized protein n=1 Tax=Rhizophora mucronata TaxID=61149 RepID=A0A2P2KP80_RHIMU
MAQYQEKLQLFQESLTPPMSKQVSSLPRSKRIVRVANQLRIRCAPA